MILPLRRQEAPEQAHTYTFAVGKVRGRAFGQEALREGSVKLPSTNLEKL